MTISEKIRELQGQLTPDTTAEERERLLLDIMTYQYIIDRSALKENSDLTAVSDLSVCVSFILCLHLKSDR